MWAAAPGIQRSRVWFSSAPSACQSSLGGSSVGTCRNCLLSFPGTSDTVSWSSVPLAKIRLVCLGDFSASRNLTGTFEETDRTEAWTITEDTSSWDIAASWASAYFAALLPSVFGCTSRPWSQAIASACHSSQRMAAASWTSDTALFMVANMDYKITIDTVLGHGSQILWPIIAEPGKYFIFPRTRIVSILRRFIC